MKRILALALALVMMLALASGCAEKPADGGDRVLRRASVESFTTSDPHYAARAADNVIAQHIYEGLIYVNRAGEIKYTLADKYTISEDGLTYTFELKKGVKFQTGQELKASDVLFSFERAKASPNLYTQTMFIDSVTAPDDYTIVIQLTQVTPAFIFEVSDVYIMSQEAMAGIPESFTDQISGGTGPYKLSSWKPDERIIFTAFEDYHGDKPAIKTIEMPVLGDYSASLLAFEAGELDLSVLPNEESARIKATGKYGMLTDDAGDTIYMVFNCDKAPFDDVRVRQAINYAINREDIILTAADGFGKPAYTLGSPTYLFGVPQEGEIFTYEHNIEKAKQLLADAGYPQGLTLDEPIITMGIPTFSVPTQVVQNQLAAVGIIADMQVIDSAVYVGDVMGGNFLMGSMAIAVYVDASTIARAYVSGGIDGDLNLGRYRNSEVDRLLEAANGTVDQEARLDYFRQAFDIASQEAAYLPLYWPETGYAYDQELVFDLNWPMWNWSWK